ncbi:hypothetical protein [Actinokineospora iranica]|uniref:Uncharacterized protein n=1 Tax=Actinokineospora iranica TaxID=1271860 RepID=A0A1G6M8C1_9PSEU|nr:hypothetical protein [Actinokineospora iranica]SDC51743.1 hypothetical protein SAMN05216174_102422 [Actinokineospora iranica]
MSAADDPRPIRPVPVVDTSSVAVERVRTAAEFAACLDQVRVLAGPLSHREIESRGGGRLRRTKIGQVLAGELPRREFLAAYLTVCGVPADAHEPWHRKWTFLISARLPAEPDVATVHRERDAAVARARLLEQEVAALRATAVVPPEAHESFRKEIRTLRAERDAARGQARLATRQHESTVERLRLAEAARDEALSRQRLLDNDLQAAGATIARLTETVDRLRARPRQARTESASPREPSGQKRLALYTREEADDLYGTTSDAPSPVIGDGEPIG